MESTKIGIPSAYANTVFLQMLPDSMVLETSAGVVGCCEENEKDRCYLCL